MSIESYRSTASLCFQQAMQDCPYRRASWDAKYNAAQVGYLLTLLLKCNLSFAGNCQSYAGALLYALFIDRQKGTTEIINFSQPHWPLKAMALKPRAVPPAMSDAIA